MYYNIPLFKILWDENDVSCISESLKEGKNWAVGANVDMFEEKISEYIKGKYTVAFNSGTSALHSILLSYGIGKNDEVIVPAFTFISTANAPLFVGAKPVFAEIEGQTFGLDPKDVKNKITAKTRAIIPVHYGGCPCQIKELMEIAEDNNILLIEDAAEAFGAHIGGQKVGTFGNASMFSFCQNKIITTGEGGAVVTDSEDVYEEMKLLRSHGRLENSNYFTSSEFFDYIKLGYNFRMSNLIAALGISQLSKVDKIIKLRRQNANYLNNKLSLIPEVKIMSPPDDYFNVYQLYTIRLPDANTRNKLKEFLADKGITTKVYFDPIHLTTFYKKSFGYKMGDLPITELISKQVLTLPMYPELSTNEMNYIINCIEIFFEV